MPKQAGQQLFVPPIPMKTVERDQLKCRHDEMAEINGNVQRRSTQYVVPNISEDGYIRVEKNMPRRQALSRDSLTNIADLGGCGSEDYLAIYDNIQRRETGIGLCSGPKDAVVIDENYVAIGECPDRRETLLGVAAPFSGNECDAADDHYLAIYDNPPRRGTPIDMSGRTKAEYDRASHVVDLSVVESSSSPNGRQETNDEDSSTDDYLNIYGEHLRRGTRIDKLTLSIP